MYRHILNYPVKPINEQFPPCQIARKLMKNLSVRAMVLNDADCSEIAEKFYNAQSSGAIIYYADISFDWPDKVSSFDIGKIFKSIYIPENRNKSIIAESYSYHAVFTDGRYVFDPALSDEPVVKSDYVKILKKLNPSGISFRYCQGNSSFYKGEFRR